MNVETNSFVAVKFETTERIKKERGKREPGMPWVMFSFSVAICTSIYHLLSTSWSGCVRWKTGKRFGKPQTLGSSRSANF